MRLYLIVSAAWGAATGAAAGHALVLHEPLVELLIAMIGMFGSVAIAMIPVLFGRHEQRDDLLRRDASPAGALSSQQRDALLKLLVSDGAITIDDPGARGHRVARRTRRRASTPPA